MGIFIDDTTVTGAAFGEALVFLWHFDDLHDPRQPGKVTYPLDEILLLCLLAVLAGADCFTEIALFGTKKLSLLRRFRPFKDGTPAHDHLGDILATLDAEEFQSCFVAWVSAVAGIPADMIAPNVIAPAVIAIDGKTARRSGRKGAKGTIHMVSAFAARQRLVLGQVKVAEKSNEIVAIPKLLDMMMIEGAIVTIDAMGDAGPRFRWAKPNGMASGGCQRDIAQKVLDKKADYLVALKGNQGDLRNDVELLATEQKARGFADTETSRHTTVDGDHGRIETRTTTVIHDVEWLQERHKWPGLKSIVIVESRRETNGRTEEETRYTITSLVMQAVLLGPIVRSHWAIENSLHWELDMVFRDDECRVRTNNAAANFTTLKHMSLNLLRRPTGKQSIRGRRKAASWDDDYLASLLNA